MIRPCLQRDEELADLLSGLPVPRTSAQHVDAGFVQVKGDQSLWIRDRALEPAEDHAVQRRQAANLAVGGRPPGRRGEHVDGGRTAKA